MQRNRGIHVLMWRSLILFLVACTSGASTQAPQEAAAKTAATKTAANGNRHPPAQLLNAEAPVEGTTLQPQAQPQSATSQEQQDLAPEGHINFCGKSWPLESTRLFCVDDAVTDLGPLASLRKLEFVSLTVQAKDLSALASLRNLLELELFTCGRVRDITPLAKLENLRVLSLERTGVKDVGALNGLTQLESLNLAHTSVQDLRPLEALSKLHTLYLGHNFRLRDLTPLSSLKALRKLDLEGARSATKDLSALKALGKLEDLGLRRSQPTSLVPISGLRSLRTLDLSVSRLGDLAPVAKLASSLEQLSLGGASVEGLAHLARLKKLTFLDLSHIPMTDVKPLLGLTRLKNLRLLDTKLGDAQIAALKKALPKTSIAH